MPGRFAPVISARKPFLTPDGEAVGFPSRRHSGGCSRPRRPDLGFPIAWQVRIPQRFCSVWCHGSILPLDALRKPTTSFAPPVTGREHLRTSKSQPPSGDARPAYICPLHLGPLKFAHNCNRPPGSPVVEVASRKKCGSALELSRRRTKASFGACTGRDPRCFVEF